MPAESEVGNGQVPQLQVQNENNETVITQNGAPKKVETAKTDVNPSEMENSEKCEIKKGESETQPVGDQQDEVVKNESENEIVVVDQMKDVDKENLENQCTESASDQQNEVEKLFTFLNKVAAENEPSVPAQCQLKQDDIENQQPESEPEIVQQCELRKTETETEQSVTENTQQCELKKVDTDEDVPSCPLGPSIQVEEPKVEPVKNDQPKEDVLMNGGPKKVSMFTTLDAEAVKTAYEDVRSDGSETQWAVFKFKGSRIALSATGSEFDKFREQFTENERGFGYIRIQTGDEMSKRQKFLFITWVGPGVSVIQRAKMSTDKSLVKEIVSNFAVELQLENESDFDLKHFVAELNKAGGANYGTGIRDS